MAQRVARKVDIRDKLTILPPWPHDDHLDSVAPEDNPFIARHNLAGKFVVMYSGNHSLASPLGTLLEAALALKDQPRLRFLFIGGGLGKREVEDVISRHRPTNIISLPYQPLDEIKQNEFNLNIPRYVDIFEDEEEIDIKKTQKEIEVLENELVGVQKEMAGYLKELGF
jgi:hypothetical protein